MTTRGLALMCGFLAAQAYAQADTIQLAHGAAIQVSFSMAEFAAGIGELSSIGVELVGQAPASADLASIPGSTGRYYSRILLKGWLESLDGSISVPLFDADAYRLGLPLGDIVADAQYGGGTLSGAQAIIGRDLTASLFGLVGNPVANAPGRARLVFRNDGDAFTIGTDGRSLSNAVLETMVSPDGRSQYAGYGETLQLTPPVPEPFVWSTVAGGCLLLFFMRKRLLCNSESADSGAFPCSAPESQVPYGGGRRGQARREHRRSVDPR